ncbi:MAG: hypothetical protein EOO62_09690, partial [Hymenobacter sp.]
MQQPREPELNFNQVKKDINLVDLVLTLGYQHNRAKSGSDIEKGKFHTFDYKGKPGLDQVIIYKNPAGDYLYFNRADDRDKGSVIDFLKHRIENPRIDGVVATPGKNIWASVIENAKRFLNLPAAERSTSHQLQQRIEPLQRGDTYVLNGLKRWITNGDVAKWYTVFAREEGTQGHAGIAAFIVDADAPGARWDALVHKLGQRSSHTCDLVFEDVEVPAANLLAGPQHGFK